MEQVSELKFAPKLLNKKHQYEKSLGDQMSSPVVANSAESEENFGGNLKDGSYFGGDLANGQSSSYGLRENPRKTWRAVDSSFVLPMEKFCKQCGKGFQSVKALSGHMASHSDNRDTNYGGLKKADHSSWATSDSDTEEDEEPMLRTTRSSVKSMRYKNIPVKSPHFSVAINESTGFEIVGQEQVDVALCLMLLSRDSGNYKGGVNSVGIESSDNNSTVLETKSSSLDMRNGKHVHVGGSKLKDHVLDDHFTEMENSDSGYFLNEYSDKQKSDVSVDWYRMNRSVGREEEYGSEYNKSFKGMKRCRTEPSKMLKDNEYSSDDDLEMWNISQKKSKYECINCKKTFKSYQALGGHRPCNKKMSTGYYESGEIHSPEDSYANFRSKGSKLVESKKPTAKKYKQEKGKATHACPFCDRVFKNGQALGGHKRTHSMAGYEEPRNVNHIPLKKPQEFPDLNLPAAEADDEDDVSGQFFRR